MKEITKEQVDAVLNLLLCGVSTKPLSESIIVIQMLQSLPDKVKQEA